MTTTTTTRREQVSSTEKQERVKGTHLVMHTKRDTTSRQETQGLRTKAQQGRVGVLVTRMTDAGGLVACLLRRVTGKRRP